MSIGIDFILKANTSSFTKGLAAVDSATSKLQRSLAGKFEGRDLARGLATAFGLSIDKIADKFARLWTGMSQQTEDAYKRMVDLSDELTKKTIEAGEARLSNEQKYQLALVQTEQLQNRISNNLGKTLEDQNRMMEDKIALLDKEKQAIELKSKIEKEEQDKSDEREKNRIKIAEDVAKIKEDDAKYEKERRREAAEDFNKAEKDLMDTFAPSVEQLASMSTGGFTAPDDPRLIARQILEKEKFAAEAGGRGDISGALSMGREARSMRESLQFTTGGGTALTAETAESALKNALEQTNAELAKANERLAGMLKAQ